MRVRWRDVEIRIMAAGRNRDSGRIYVDAA